MCPCAGHDLLACLLCALGGCDLLTTATKIHGTSRLKANDVPTGKGSHSLVALASSVERKRSSLTKLMTMNQNWATRVQKA